MSIALSEIFIDVGKAEATVLRHITALSKAKGIRLVRAL